MWSGVHTTYLVGTGPNSKLTPSLCISYSTKSDIHGIIMNPYNTKTYLKYKPLSAPHSGKKIIQSSYNS